MAREVHFWEGPLHGQTLMVPDNNAWSYTVAIPPKVSWDLDSGEPLGPSMMQYNYSILSASVWGKIKYIGYAGEIKEDLWLDIVDHFGWGPKPKPVGKTYIKPCLKCKAARAMTYSLKLDTYSCSICNQMYSSATMAQVKDNFTYPATAAYLKSFFPFFVASSYPKEYQKQMYQQKYEQILKTPVYLDTPCTCPDCKPVDPAKSYRNLASIEFDGVEELDPSLWSDAGDAGLL